MGKKSVRKNYLYNAGYQLLLIAAPLITSPYISRVLGADNIGRHSYVNSVVSYFVLFATLGITAYGRREISYRQDDRGERTRVFWETKLLQLFTSGLAFLLYAGFSLLQEDRLFYLVFSLNILAAALDVTWFFQGMEEFGKIVLRNTVCKLANILYIFLAVKDRGDLIWYAFGLVFFLTLSNSSLWFSLPGYVDRPGKGLRPFRDIRVVLSLFIPSVAVEVYTVLDRTMIGLIARDFAENGYYEQAMKISRMTLSVITALGPVMIPRIGHFFQKGETQVLQGLLQSGYRFVWFLGLPLCLGLMGVSANLVPWFYGPGYEKVIPLLQVLSLLILAIGLNTLTGDQYLIPTKRQNLYTVTVLIGAGTNFILNLILIPRFQSMGAAAASVAAETVIALTQLYLIRRELSLKKLLGGGGHYWIAGALMLAVLLAEERYLTPSLLHTALMVASGAFVYLGLLALMRDEFFLTNARTFLGLLRKKGR